MSEHTDAYVRFWQSTKIGYMEWHEGIGYDLEALRAMTPAERDQTVTALRARPQDWRDVEAYAAVASPDAIAALRDALLAPLADTRLRSGQRLHELGLLDDLGAFVAQELTRVSIVDGLTNALRLAVLVPTDEVRRTLLSETRRRPDVAFHLATTLCWLTGAWKLQPYAQMRKLFFRLGPANGDEDRTRAFEELCRLTGMTMTDTPAAPPSA
jgi:hypothetical protein